MSGMRVVSVKLLNKYKLILDDLICSTYFILIEISWELGH